MSAAKAPSDSTPLNILSIDGGGVRGLSCLLILDKIMERLATKLDQDKKPRPCDYFDLICGTGTGGIIALMLGRLRMSIEEAIKSYEQLARQAFKPRGYFLFFSPPSTLYDHKNLEAKIKELVETHSPDATTVADPRDQGCCKTFVVAVPHLSLDTDPRLFRSYTHKENRADEHEIWQAARATSAAPPLFEPINIDGTVFADGGLGTHNNPSNLARDEAARIWPKRKIGLHLSLGTGNQKIVQLAGSDQLLDVCSKLISNCETTANEVYKRYRSEYGVPKAGEWHPYHRFSVDRGLDKVYLGEWEKIGDLTSITGAYLRGPQEVVEMGDVVETLHKRGLKLAEQAEEDEALM